MRKQPRLFLLALLFPVALTLGGGAAAQDGHAAHGDAVAHAQPSEMKRVLWSDPAAWPGGRVICRRMPSGMAEVLSPDGVPVLDCGLDHAPPR